MVSTRCVPQRFVSMHILPSKRINVYSRYDQSFELSSIVAFQEQRKKPHNLICSPCSVSSTIFTVTILCTTLSEMSPQDTSDPQPVGLHVTSRLASRSFITSKQNQRKASSCHNKVRLKNEKYRKRKH